MRAGTLPSMRVKTDLGELYLEDSGTGPAVILWHSFLHHGGMWRGQLAALRARYRVLNLDAPGHGRSAQLRRPIDMAECARAVPEIDFEIKEFAGGVMATFAQKQPASPREGVSGERQRYLQ